MNKLGLKKIDLYIIKKFLGTYFYAIAIIISIAVVFDLSEKIEDFLEKEAPLRAIVLDYYLNFIPYFANLFSSLFTFIAVIFFTSKMAYNTEIIAILSNGVSFRRILFPYFISASVIGLLSYLLM
ncbi:MAG: LptF/LptG family permease, partial [Bacteroidota bacterium]|nr:LptF/LptG family permease [Bacteroidota bacterium]